MELRRRQWRRHCDLHCVARDGKSDSDSDSDTNTNSDSDSDADSKSNTNSDCNSNANRNSDTNTNSGSELLTVDQSVVGDGSAQWWNCYLHRGDYASGRFQFADHDVSEWLARGSNGNLRT
jgi:hypothetical protein